MAHQLQIIPNPISKVFRVFSPNGLQGGETLYIIDVMGKSILEVNLNAQNTELEKPNAPDGLYFWHIVSGDTEIGKGKLLFQK